MPNYRNQNTSLSSIEADYLSAIYLLCIKEEYTNLEDIASAINTKTKTADVILSSLEQKGYVVVNNYTLIELTQKGYVIGEYLYEKHYIIENLFKLLNIKENLLEVEKLEHFLSDETLEAIQKLVMFFHEHPNILFYFEEYIK